MTSRSLFACFVLFGVVLPGCLEVETSTSVHSDGSLERTITFTGDSAEVASRHYPLTIDSSWSTSEQKVEAKKFRYTAYRSFENAQVLTEAIKGKEYRTLDVNVRLERRFLWFVTTYRYEETYRRFNPFNSIPVTEYVPDYFLKLEMESVGGVDESGSRGDSLAISAASARYEEWQMRNFFEAYFEVVLGGVRKLNVLSLRPEFVVARKEKLFSLSQKPLQENKIDTLAIIFGKTLKTSLMPQALAANVDEVRSFREKMNFRVFIASSAFKVNVQMPGIITNTNARTIEGASVQFKDFIGVGNHADYTMWVESRAMNWWAMITTAVVILAGGLLFAAALVKKRKGTA